MARRYIPAHPFHTRIGGVKRSYNPAYKDPATGLPGYSEADVPEQIRSSFRVIDVTADTPAGDDQPVETTTAAPGEKRAVGRPRKDATVTPAPVTTKASTS